MDAFKRRVFAAYAEGRIDYQLQKKVRAFLEDDQADRARSKTAREEKKKAAKKGALGASVAHHAKERRAEEREAEEVSEATRITIRDRSLQDHLGRLCCEACHAGYCFLEPHHLILQDRVDAPELVMLLCADCHRLDPKSAHRSPRRFAHETVLPWLSRHGYPTPNRKEYRTP